MKNITIQLLIAFAVFGFVEYATALQCYTCDNCIEDEDLTELQICGQLSPGTEDDTSSGSASKPATTGATANNDRRSTTTTTARTTTAASDRKTTTKRPSDDSDENDSSDDEEDSKSTKTTRTTLRPSNIRTTKKPSMTTTKADKDDDDNESNSSSEDDDADDDDKRRRRRRAVGDQAVCYMVKLLVNNSIVTKRGCTVMKDSNVTCEELNDGETMTDCQLCDTNGCNKFRLDSSGTGALWNNAITQHKVVNGLVLLAFGVLLLNRHR